MPLVLSFCLMIRLPKSVSKVMIILFCLLWLVPLCLLGRVRFPELRLCLCLSV